MGQLHVEEIGPGFGAKVSGLDTNEELNEEACRTLKAALDSQGLSPEERRRAIRRLGVRIAPGCQQELQRFQRIAAARLAEWRRKSSCANSFA